ncbi:MAG TPA: type II toxin-antitoxin system PemK/MazF family toxin [Verrucomicrobiae bacterium]|nr:type II toxin-antitoxin system PemK/MazF family toxin [Verrucomicrobiae bacterium]
MNPGDIHWVEFPAGAGRAQAGRRPAVVAQAASATAALPTILLIPLTTQFDALRFPGTVLIERDSSNNLRQNSVALAFQLTAIDKRFVSGRLGAVAADKMAELWAALDEVLGRSRGLG